ncbi:MAG: hypothetical protein R3B95_05250 [Nitrospirales bacterium]|nr:hypothetical protein [Nitrospirales bacterium]
MSKRKLHQLVEENHVDGWGSSVAHLERASASGLHRLNRFEIFVSGWGWRNVTV